MPSSPGTKSARKAPGGAAAVCSNEVDVAVAVQVPVGESLAVLVERRVDSLVDGVEPGVAGIEYGDIAGHSLIK